ncbi:MAG: exodeoxyribonuclease VII small subunit [Solirubrobacteraceae bacterium]
MNPDAIGDTGQSRAIVFEPADDLELRAGRGEGAQERERITFEQGYEELKRIVARLDDPELPIHEMFEGFRRGKGLEKTLRAYLQEREGELAELEQGNNLAEFEIVAPSSGGVVG